MIFDNIVYLFRVLIILEDLSMAIISSIILQLRIVRVGIYVNGEIYQNNLHKIRILIFNKLFAAWISLGSTEQYPSFHKPLFVLRLDCMISVVSYKSVK